MVQMFDTLEATHRLEGGGFTREQAEAIATVVRASQGELATKADLERLGEATKADFERLSEATKADLREAVGKLRGEMKELEVRLTWRMVALAGLIVIANGGLLALFRFAGGP